MTGISIEHYGECNPDSTSYTINGQLIETRIRNFGPCACPVTETYSSTGTYAGYTYGGNNTITFNATAAGSTCHYAAEVTLTYQVSIPTLNEWGMIIFSSLLGITSIYYMRKRLY